MYFYFIFRSLYRAYREKKIIIKNTRVNTIKKFLSVHTLCVNTIYLYTTGAKTTSTLNIERYMTIANDFHLLSR